MNTAELIIFLVIVGAITVVVLLDGLIGLKRRIKRQETLLHCNAADMKHMNIELASWEKCVELMLEDKKEEVLQLLDEKIQRAAAKKRIWEVNRFEELKQKVLKRN